MGGAGWRKRKFAYFCIMYVRKKKNRSGTISVAVVDKSSGRYREIKNFGAAISEDEAESLSVKACLWIRTYSNQQEFDFEDSKGRELEETERVIDNMLIIRSLQNNITRN